MEGEKAVGEVLKTEAELTMLHSRPRPLPGLYVCELNNHRVMRYAGTGGEVVVGGFGRGSAPGQLAGPRKLCADEEFLYLSELGNRRVTRWVPSLRGQAAGCEVLTGHLEEPWGICVDRAAVYVADAKAHAVTRWVQRKGTVEAGGRGPGDGLDQLNQPVDVALDSRGRLYVAERGNDRVTRWHGRNCEIVAGGQGWGDDLEQLAGPTALALQEVGGETAVLVAEAGNNRITRWWPGQPRCEILIGGVGSLPNLDAPEGLHYDAQEGCIYVAVAEMNLQQFCFSGSVSSVLKLSAILRLNLASGSGKQPSHSLAIWSTRRDHRRRQGQRRRASADERKLRCATHCRKWQKS